MADWFKAAILCGMVLGSLVHSFVGWWGVLGILGCVALDALWRIMSGGDHGG